MQAEPAKYRIESVSHAAEVLCAFLRPPHRFGVTELTNGLGLTKNHTFRILQTLMLSGLVVQDPVTKSYRLGPRLVDLASVAVHGSSLVPTAAPVLDALARQTKETVNLITRLDAHSAICVDKRDSPWMLQITASIGARFALHAGASPKLLLAFSPAAEIETYFRECQPLAAFTANTLTDPAALRTELERIRARGYALSDEEMDRGVCSIAAPIRDRTGSVVAGVSVAAPTIRCGPDERRRTTAAVRAAAHEISARLAQGGAHDGIADRNQGSVARRGSARRADRTREEKR